MAATCCTRTKLVCWHRLALFSRARRPEDSPTLHSAFQEASTTSGERSSRAVEAVRDIAACDACRAADWLDLSSSRYHCETKDKDNCKQHHHQL